MSDNNTANFEGNCGECKGSGSYNSASCPGGMQPGQSATVNSQSPQNCIIANDGATVFAIELQQVAGLWPYQIRVQAKGPSGIFSGFMHLAFEDMSTDVYYLSIFSSKEEWHEVSYNSASPNIQTIYWSDHSFSVNTGDASREKPEFKVVSPVDKAIGLSRGGGR